MSTVNKLNSSQYGNSEISLLLNNFDYQDNRNENFCIYYNHKTKGKITESDINFEISLVKYKDEHFRLCFSITFDAIKRDDIIDILFSDKSLILIDEDANINFHRNQGFNANSYFFITPKNIYRQYFAQDGEKMIIKFRNSTEIIYIKDKLLKALSETYALGLYLNKN